MENDFEAIWVQQNVLCFHFLSCCQFVQKTVETDKNKKLFPISYRKVWKE